MKKSFSSIRQVCHVWAQQSQEEGKSGNVYFERFTDLYSYGSHYLAARIHTLPDGDRVALIRSDSYSPSTSGHLSDARSAVSDLMPYFSVPDVRTLNSLENFNHFNDLVIDQVESVLKSIKITNQYDLQWSLERLFDVLKEANEYFLVAGFPQLDIPKEMIDLCKEHLQFRLNRYQELNTPEMIEKREIDKLKRDQKQRENELKKLQDAIIQWRNGHIHIDRSMLRFIPYVMLRVRDNVVQTSSGAEVPLNHALRLLTLVERDHARTGERCGHFTLERVYENNEGETIVKIGCHSIKLSEAQSVLAPYREQELRIAE